MRRRRRDAPDHLHQASGRLHWLQLRTVLEVALDPAALHHDCLIAALQCKGCQHIEARHAVHLPVVEIDGLGSEPQAAQPHGPQHLVGTFVGRQKRLLIELGAPALRLAFGLHRFFLRCTRQLPAPERRRRGNGQEGCDRDDPETASSCTFPLLAGAGGGGATRGLPARIGIVFCIAFQHRRRAGRPIM